VVGCSELKYQVRWVVGRHLVVRFQGSKKGLPEIWAVEEAMKIGSPDFVCASHEPIRIFDLVLDEFRQGRIRPFAAIEMGLTTNLITYSKMPRSMRTGV